MSTRVGTQQAPMAGGSILIATFLASLVMLTIGVVAISIDQGRQGETTFVGRQLVNTPVVNTPSELNAQARRELGIKAHKFLSDKLGTNAPTELSGGVISDGFPAEIYARHQRR